MKCQHLNFWSLLVFLLVDTIYICYGFLHLLPLYHKYFRALIYISYKCWNLINPSYFQILSMKIQWKQWGNLVPVTSDCNWTRSHSHLIRKRTPNYLAKLAKLASLAKLLSVRLQTKWLWVRVQAQLFKLKISRPLWARSSLTFRQLKSVVSIWNAYVTWQERTALWLGLTVNATWIWWMRLVSARGIIMFLTTSSKLKFWDVKKKKKTKEDPLDLKPWTN